VFILHINYTAECIHLSTLLVFFSVLSAVIILAIRGDKVRQIALHAYDQGLINGDYIFFSLIYYPQKRAYGDFNWKQVNIFVTEYLQRAEKTHLDESPRQPDNTPFTLELICGGICSQAGGSSAEGTARG
jgi:hypothetical protein